MYKGHARARARGGARYFTNYFASFISEPMSHATTSDIKVPYPYFFKLAVLLRSENRSNDNAILTWKIIKSKFHLSIFSYFPKNRRDLNGIILSLRREICSTIEEARVEYIISIEK